MKKIFAFLTSRFIRLIVVELTGMTKDAIEGVIEAKKTSSDGGKKITAKERGEIAKEIAVRSPKLIDYIVDYVISRQK